MRLIKQSYLYFKEGNSDKVYVIDLCDVGNEKYVVNFSYGRRDAQLKEGSKTPVPVDLQQAERIYDTVETEKLSKGYTTESSGITGKPVKKTFTPNSNRLPINTDWYKLPDSRQKAVLQRLENAVSGKENTEYKWKLSRVIWKAGDLKIKEAAPYIAALFTNGDKLHQYCCTWALSRCGGNNAAAMEILKDIYNSHPDSAIAKIAGVGLLRSLTGSEREIHIKHYLNRLPEDLKIAIESADPSKLTSLLDERILQQQPGYKWLEDLYIVSLDKRWLRSVFHTILDTLPLRPNYFKHIRAIFKQSALLEDFELEGLLACRFEREPEMFSISPAISFDDGEVYIPDLDISVKPYKELKKANTRLAYSNKTRWYFHRSVLRQFQLAGENNDITYVKLAVSLLIAYKFDKDFKKEFSTFNYVWNNRQYDNVETKFLQNSHAVFLHQLISGDDPLMLLQSNHLWRQVSANEKVLSYNKNKSASNGRGLLGFLKKVSGFFSKKKPAEAKQTVALSTDIKANPHGTRFLHLWNEMPEAYLQLMMYAELEEIHKFAHYHLTSHPDYIIIKEQLDKQSCIKLLSSSFIIPAAFGYRLISEKYNDGLPDDDLVSAMLNSVDEKAVAKGKEWAEKYQADYIQQSNFIVSIIFAKHSAVRTWARSFLKNALIASSVKNGVIGKAIATFINFTASTTGDESLISDVHQLLFQLFEEELKLLDTEVLHDLLSHESAMVQRFGLDILKVQKPQLDLGNLSKEFVVGLLRHKNAAIRDEGILFLSDMNDKTLASYGDEVITESLSPYQNVRQGLASVIGRIAKNENSFGVLAAEKLMPFLLRKETAEGVHADLGNLLSNELSGYLQNANKENALNLLYSDYKAAQDVGIVILEKYTDPSQLSIGQVIALGGHENLNIRTYSWKFYNEHSSRIKFERETSIKLLESKWEDTRLFAMSYFREQFVANDWTPEILITLSDSVKPQLEAFGRELITKFFTPENGVRYLLQLSQHPSEKMQLFATNYLDRFATGDLSRIQSLEFYFRSILTRVNRSRIAKNRIYQFLLQEGKKSDAAAKFIATILSDVSVNAAIGDKAKCIEILFQLRDLYELATPLKIKEMEVRLS